MMSSPSEKHAQPTIKEIQIPSHKGAARQTVLSSSYHRRVVRIQVPSLSCACIQNALGVRLQRNGFSQGTSLVFHMRPHLLKHVSAVYLVSDSQALNYYMWSLLPTCHSYVQQLGPRHDL